jgi:NDP-sugar pyrophosphorylase family protein
MDRAVAMDAVILCGGMGTRLQPVIPDRPKGLATIRGRPFLDILVDDLLAQGIRRFVLCVGHLKEQIIEHFGGRDDADFLFSVENAPLGTGGAIRNALHLIRSDPFLALNGDSFCRVDYAALLRFHREKAAMLTVVAAPVRDRKDGGNSINAGIYVIPRKTADAWRFEDPFSLEREVIPPLVAGRRCYGFAVDSEVIDIGTPERYSKAQRGII